MTDPFPDLHVVSVVPVDNTTNVPANANMVITFSQQMNLGTIGMVLAPAPADFYTNLELSDDRRQVISRATLAPNTSYSLVVYSAVDRYADVLRVPYVSRFHTAAVTPTGGVTGSSAAPFNAPTQSFAGLLRKSLQAVAASDNADQEFNENLVAVSSIKDAAGAYEIAAIAPGIYWPFAALDVDRNGRLSLQSGDRLQGFDANADGLPDSVTIASATLNAIALNAPVESFRVLSYLPANGARNLGLQSEFRLAFSAPLDTSKFGLFISPEPAGFSKASLTLSADAKIVSSTLTLQSNTSYSALLFAANSTRGQIMRLPLLIQFTSANDFPRAEVSGQVVFGLSPDSTRHTLVGLLRQDVPTLLNRVIVGRENVNKVLSSALQAMTSVADEAGNFAITYVADGTYWPVAAKDFNGNGSFDLGTDPIGIFDNDGDGVASVGDSLQVRNGVSVTGVQMTRLF
ncbi:MAG: Ig-like domain-containing protein [bacterium]